MTDQALKSVAAQLARLKLSAKATTYNPGADVPYQRAVRPDYGTQGKPVTVLANHFALKLKAQQAFHYDVSSECGLRGGAVLHGVWDSARCCAESCALIYADPTATHASFHPANLITDTPVQPLAPEEGPKPGAKPRRPKDRE